MLTIDLTAASSPSLEKSEAMLVNLAWIRSVLPVTLQVGKCYCPACLVTPSLCCFTCGNGNSLRSYSKSDTTVMDSVWDSHPISQVATSKVQKSVLNSVDDYGHEGRVIPMEHALCTQQFSHSKSLGGICRGQNNYINSPFTLSCLAARGRNSRLVAFRMIYTCQSLCTCSTASSEKKVGFRDMAS